MLDKKQAPAALIGTDAGGVKKSPIRPYHITIQISTKLILKR